MSYFALACMYIIVLVVCCKITFGPVHPLRRRTRKRLGQNRLWNEVWNCYCYSVCYVSCLRTIFLNNPRAVNFVCRCFQGKNWSIQYLAVCGKSVILWPIWGGCTCVIFIQFSGNVILSTYFQKLWHKYWGHQVCLEATVQNISSNHNWEKLSTRQGGTYWERNSNFIIMLNFLFCRYL